MRYRADIISNANHPLSIRHFVSGLLIVLFAVPNLVSADSTLTPRVQVKESFMSNKTAVLDESGQITSISPGILYEATGSRSNLSFDYSLDSRYYSGLSQTDETNQALALRAGLTHVPDHWDSYLTSTVRQANVSSDGVQIVNTDFQSKNTREFRTLGLGTAWNDRLTDSLDYVSQLDMDYAGFEKDTSSNSASIRLGLNNNRSPAKLSWGVSLNSRKTSQGNQNIQIDTIRGDLNYRFNRKYSAFLTLDKSATDNKDKLLSKTNSNIGLLWTPNKNSSLKLGAGKRGSDTSYILDASFKTKRIVYTANYDEIVTTTRALLITETQDPQAFVPTSQGLSITPLLIKNGRVAITVVGKKTDLTLAYFNQQRVQSGTINNKGKTEGLSVSAKRRLSGLSSIQLHLSRQDSKISQNNTLDDSSITYIRQWSKSIDLSVALRKTEQKSNIVENAYQQNVLSLQLSAVF